MNTICGTVKREIGKKCVSEHLPTLLKNVNILIHLNQAVDCFKNYFLSLIDRLNLIKVQTHSAIL